MSTLIIAEKSQAAKAIAEALGQTQQIKESKFITIQYIPSKNIYVLPLRGHILSYKNSEEFKSWANSNPREIITNPSSIKKIPLKYGNPYITALKKYGRICDSVVISTDCDLEGCNIGFFDALPYVKQVNPTIQVSQLWLSTLQKSEIQRKYNNLITPKISWGEAGEARAIIDAIIGFSATREVTNTLKNFLKAFNVQFTSIGRVQTSALFLLYLREKQILDFIPEKYLTIEATLIEAKDTFNAQHKNNPFKKTDMINAKKIYEKIRNEKIAVIENYNKNLVKKKPPTPLNTNKALILLTKNLGINAKTALSTMNDLYLSQIISYPRTDSDVYKPDFPHKNLVEMFKNHSEYGKFTQDLIKNGRFKPTKGKKDAGDHPPITPIECLELTSNKLKTNLQIKVYNLLARHYLALFGEDATESKQDLDLRIKEEPFKAQIVSLVDPGYLEIAPFLKPKYDTEIQISGNNIPVKKVNLHEKETKPPPHYTDTTLLKLMEINGLGTKSTRPTIIEIMQKRKVIDKKERKFYVSDLGIFLIENLMKVWLPFLKPTFTRDVEIRLEMIKDEKMKMDTVISEVKKEFLELFDKFRASKQELVDNANEYKIPKNEVASKPKKDFPLTKANCPFCNIVPMKYINIKNKRFLVCSDDNCKKYLPLPKTGLLKLLDSTCSVCGFNIFKVRKKKDKDYITYYLCPKCWVEGLETKSGKGFCSGCNDFKIQDEKCVKR